MSRTETPRIAATSPLPCAVRIAARRTFFPAMAALACALFLCSCGDDPVEAPTIENFARAWHLTACEYRSESNDGVSVDLVGEGWTMDLFINDNGMFLYSWTPPVGDPGSYGGTWVPAGQTVSLTREGAGFAWVFTAEVREESMTLRGAHAEYDFDGNGAPEAAIWNLAGSN